MGDEDFIDAAIDQAIDSKVEAKLKQESAQREDGVEWLIDAKLREREFYKALNDAYPNWKETWKTPEFQAFLSQVDEDSLLPYPNYTWIEAAFKRCDAQTVIKAFKLFSEGKPRRKDSRQSFNPAGMSRERAKRELLKLADAKKKGLWDGREAEYTKRSDALTKIILGQGD